MAAKDWFIWYLSSSSRHGAPLRRRKYENEKEIMSQGPPDVRVSLHDENMYFWSARDIYTGRVSRRSRGDGDLLLHLNAHY